MKGRADTYQRIVDEAQRQQSSRGARDTQQAVAAQEQWDEQQQRLQDDVLQKLDGSDRFQGLLAAQKVSDAKAQAAAEGVTGGSGLPHAPLGSMLGMTLEERVAAELTQGPVEATSMLGTAAPMQERQGSSDSKAAKRAVATPGSKAALLHSPLRTSHVHVGFEDDASSTAAGVGAHRDVFTPGSSVSRRDISDVAAAASSDDYSDSVSARGAPSGHQLQQTILHRTKTK